MARNAMVVIVLLAAGSVAGCADEPAEAKASLAATAAVAPPAATSADTMRRSDTPTQAVVEQALAESVQKAREMDAMRETFAYAGGPRDPFASLIDVDKAGPEIGDLDLVGVYLDLRSPANNVVVLREKTSSKRHKLRVGDQLGRARLTQIRPRDVVFKIQDFGFERQETLSLRKQEVETP
ncbi:MAG: hypothetical protein ABIQ49_07175 [Gemmatimonadales bacterium]